MRVGFKMKLLPGFEAEYKKRHDEIWPELRALLKNSGISDYVIYLDKETHILFASLVIDDRAKLNELPDEPVMQKWWQHMKDIMETNADSSPMSIPLQEMFYLE
ncbi:MAG TPA: L-rhamnose mutarotase [Puia sp.]|nr:L-rhamnose mutarotase [Puia sp.]